MEAKKKTRRNRIKKGIRAKISGSGDRPRISIFRSNRAIYAQIIDDVKGNTLVSASSRELGNDSVTVDSSKEVGKKLAEKAKGSGIETVIFDRSGYAYHGNVKALAEGAREGGLKF